MTVYAVNNIFGNQLFTFIALFIGSLAQVGICVLVYRLIKTRRYSVAALLLFTTCVAIFFVVQRILILGDK
jgi:hypothetical protein